MSGGEPAALQDPQLRERRLGALPAADTHSRFSSCSLEGRFEDEELQQILDDIQTKRSFQY